MFGDLLSQGCAQLGAALEVEREVWWHLRLLSMLHRIGRSEVGREVIDAGETR